MKRLRRTALFFLFVLMSAGVGCQNQRAQTPSGPEAGSELYEESAEPHGYGLPSGTQKIMKAKLAHAQGILEALALEDFVQVVANARALRALSEEADWQMHQTLAYNQFSAELRRVLDGMIEHATKKNIEAVTLDYMQMTMTCVRCHSYMRHEGLAGGGAWSDVATR